MLLSLRVACSLLYVSKCVPYLLAMLPHEDLVFTSLIVVKHTYGLHFYGRHNILVCVYTHRASKL